jgi:hypothetical protein
MGVVGGLLAVFLAPPFLKSYWHPGYVVKLDWPFGGLEDLFYGFFVVGIGSVAYEELFGKHFTKRKSRDASMVRFIFPALAFYILSFYLPVWLGLPVIYSAFFSFAVLLTVILGMRRDLFQDALVSGLVLGLLVFAGYLIFLKIFPQAIQHLWDMKALSGATLGGIPTEEIMWAFGLGAASGPVYEFFAGKRFK